MNRNSKVTAIIPTRNRPELIQRAVRSAFAQTYEDLEVIVVVDGPDVATVQALSDLDDKRLKVIALPESKGAQNARNIGIGVAQGDWIALLDDDDEWLPDKTSLQMAYAEKTRFRYPIVASQVFARTKAYELVWPRRKPYHPISEYLLARNSWSRGEGLLHTTTLLFPKDLIRLVPLALQLKRCHDVDWLLRAFQQEHSGIEFIAQPLAIVHQEEERLSITNVPDWRTSLEWIESVRESITGRAYASYLSITVASQAARQKDWMAIPFLFRRIITKGAPKLRDLAFFIGVWSVPRKLQLAARKAKPSIT